MREKAQAEDIHLQTGGEDENFAAAI